MFLSLIRAMSPGLAWSRSTVIWEAPSSWPVWEECQKPSMAGQTTWLQWLLGVRNANNRLWTKCTGLRESGRIEVRHNFALLVAVSKLVCFPLQIRLLNWEYHLRMLSYQFWHFPESKLYSTSTFYNSDVACWGGNMGGLLRF